MSKRGKWLIACRIVDIWRFDRLDLPELSHTRIGILVIRMIPHHQVVEVHKFAKSRACKPCSWIKL